MANPFASLPKLVEPRGGLGAGAPWIVGAAVAVALHAGAGLWLLPSADSNAAPQAPEAAILIDLPPDADAPPLESVEARAAPDGAAATAPAQDPTEIAPAEHTTLPEPDVPAPEKPTTRAPAGISDPTDDATPGPAVETPSPAPTAAPAPIEAAKPPAEPEPPPAPVAAAPAPVTPVPPVQAPPSPIAEPVARVETPVSADPVVAPAPPVVPTAKPAPAVDRKPSARADRNRPPAVKVERRQPSKPRAEKPVALARAAPAARIAPAARASTVEKGGAGAQGAVQAQRGSGAGRPDPNALARYLSAVRADIMRQRRGVDLDGRGRTAVVRFSIDASGAVGAVTLASSSGDPRLDAAAIDMVRRASPVPAIPAPLGGRLKTRLSVRFD